MKITENGVRSQRDEYKKFCFIYGTQHVERLFAGFKGYQEVRETSTHEEVVEETESYFNTV